MQTVAYDVALMPEPSLCRAAVDASKQLAQFDSLFILGARSYYPHLSLYMCQLDVDHLDEVKDALAAIASTYAPFALTSVGYSHEEGYIDVEYHKQRQLVELQRAVVRVCNPLRVGLRENDQKHMQEAQGLELENYRKYGYRYIGDLFRPHLTFTRLRREQRSALEILGTVDKFSGTFSQLGLFTIGSNGTALRRLAEFKLLNAGSDH